MRSFILLTGLRRCPLQFRAIGVLVELEPSAGSDLLFKPGIGPRRHSDFPLLAALPLHMNPPLHIAGVTILAQTLKLIPIDMINLRDPRPTLPLEGGSQTIAFS